MREKIFLMAFVFLSVLFLSGCQPAQYEGTPLEGEILELCKLNASPTLFLYPAIDKNSVSPKFFDNTVYEIIKDGKYLGKFDGDRFNHSYLNLSYGDTLEMIITAENDKCYVLDNQIRYVIPCKENNYIIPETRCAENIVFDMTYQGWLPYTSLNNGDTIETTKDYIIIDLRVLKQGDFNYFGCSFDRNILNFEVKNLFRGENIWQEGKSYKMYELDSSRDYEIVLAVEPQQKPFNSTINCQFFDEAFFIESYKIVFDITDRYYNDVGQPNPTFNFTINYRGVKNG